MMVMGDNQLGLASQGDLPQSQNPMSGASSYYNNIINNRGLTSSP